MDTNNIKSILYKAELEKIQLKKEIQQIKKGESNRELNLKKIRGSKEDKKELIEDRKRCKEIENLKKEGYVLQKTIEGIKSYSSVSYQTNEEYKKYSKRLIEIYHLINWEKSFCDKEKDLIKLAIEKRNQTICNTKLRIKKNEYESEEKKIKQKIEEKGLFNIPT